MGSRRIVPVILFIGLLIGGSYYYLCQIKGVCDGLTANLTTSIADSAGMKPDEMSPLSFRYNSAEPIIGNDFETMRETLLSKVGEADTLVVNAMYYENEANGEALADERAANVKSLFIDYFDANRLLVNTSFDGITRADDKSSLEAIQFTVVSGDLDNSDGESSTDTEEYVETEDFEDSNGEDETANTSNIGQQGSVEALNDKAIIYFSKGSVRKNMSDDVRSYINVLVAQLGVDPSLKVYVIGHSDDEGDEDESYQLGRKRAWVVKKMIWDRGVDPNRIITSSKGGLEPLNQNDTEVDRAYNRRVEIKTYME
jgi:outer membrane protein OmpA-like peptidoglycan-associated protein